MIISIPLLWLRIALAIAFMAVNGIAADPADEITTQRLDDGSVRWSSVRHSVRGILVRPAGDGPFPAVVVSHGLGGRAATFGLTKAREFARWGMIVIAPDYTHAQAETGPGGSSSDRSTFGASAENVRRARFCVAWLRARPDVDRRRLAAYGHSMGGFVTIALAAEEPLAAAAISGSGMAPREGFPAPGPEIVRNVRTPMLMLHGADDPVVRPAQSDALKRLLDEAGVPNERIVWPGVGHDVDRAREADVFNAIRAWFERHGVLAASTGNDRPPTSTPAATR